MLERFLQDYHTFPVVLVKGILDGHNGVFLDEGAVDIGELSWSQISLLVVDISGVLVFEVLGIFKNVSDFLQLTKIVLVDVGLPEFRSGNIHGDANLASVASGFNGSDNEVEGVRVDENVGSESTLVTDVGGVLAELLLGQSLEVVVGFGTHSHGFGERSGSVGEEHELLHGELVASMGSAVDDVENWNGEGQFLGVVSSELGRGFKRCEKIMTHLSNVSVEWDFGVSSSGLGDGERNAKNSVGTELFFVVGSIEVQENLVHSSLVGEIEVLADESSGDWAVDVGDGLGNTLAVIFALDCKKFKK